MLLCDGSSAHCCVKFSCIGIWFLKSHLAAFNLQNCTVFGQFFGRFEIIIKPTQFDDSDTRQQPSAVLI